MKCRAYFIEAEHISLGLAFAGSILLKVKKGGYFNALKQEYYKIF